MGLDLWTLRRRLQQLAGVTSDQYREYAGWEWFVESVLRTHCGRVAAGGGKPSAPTWEAGALEERRLTRIGVIQHRGGAG